MSAVRPILKGIHSPDAFNLEEYIPEIEDDFCLLIQAMFGPENDDGEESFDVLICTPKWLERTIGPSAYPGRHHIIVNKFDYKLVFDFLADYSKKCEGLTWNEAAQRLSRIGKWEFEDYES